MAAPRACAAALIASLLLLSPRPVEGDGKDGAEEEAAAYGLSAFVRDGPTSARNFDEFLGGLQTNSSGALPTAAELESDRAWVDRFYGIGVARVPDRLSNLTEELASRYIRSGRPFIVTDMISD
eukprot:SAG22_NODE_10324_length_541_cov_1.097285_1_plen_123_part_01